MKKIQLRYCEYTLQFWPTPRLPVLGVWFDQYHDPEKSRLITMEDDAAEQWCKNWNDLAFWRTEARAVDMDVEGYSEDTVSV